MVHKKPTEPFGYIAFGKNSSVKNHIKVPPDEKAEQENEVMQATEPSEVRH